MSDARLSAEGGGGGGPIWLICSAKDENSSWLIEPLLSLSMAANNWSSGDCVDDAPLLDNEAISGMLEVADDVAVPVSEPEICCNDISSDMMSWLNELPLEPDEVRSSEPDEGGGGGGASVWVVNADDPVDPDADVAELEELDCNILSNEKISDDPTLPTDMAIS